MGTKTYKVCDRCKVEAVRDERSPGNNPVQNLNYQIPNADKPLSGAEGKVCRDLCGKCRAELLTILDDFFNGVAIEVRALIRA